MAEIEEERPMCRRCGDAHEIFACPHVKALEFEHGYVLDSPGPPSVRRIEFLTPADCVSQRAQPAQEAGPDYPRKVPR